MKQLVLIGVFLALIYPIFAQEPLQDGDQIASLVDGSGWVILHEDMTWESVTFEDLMTRMGSDAFLGTDPPEKTRTWRSISRVDPITDVLSITFYTDAIEGKSNSGSVPVLRIYISESGETFVSIWWDDYLGSKAQVTWRIDQHAPVEDWWRLSPDSEATFFSGDDKALSLQLLKAERFIARITPYKANTVTAIFDVTGVREFLSERPALLKVLEESQSTDQ